MDCLHAGLDEDTGWLKNIHTEYCILAVLSGWYSYKTIGDSAWSWFQAVDSKVDSL